MADKIPSRTGEAWGLLKPHPKVKMPLHSARVLGACVDFTVEAIETVEMQILWLLNVKLPRQIKDALWLYFSVTEVEATSKAGHQVLGEILTVLRTVRLGIEKERGKLEICQNDPGMGKGLKGYVMAGFFGGRGPVHMDFRNIMSTDLQKGAAYFMNLYVHEATHRYAATIDVPVGRSKKLAYLSTSTAPNLLDAYAKLRTTDDVDKARLRMVGPEGVLLTTKEALNNADSFSWFVQAMMQDHARSLDIAMKFKKRILASTAAAFKDEQRAALIKVLKIDEGTIDALSTYFAVT